MVIPWFSYYSYLHSIVHFITHHASHTSQYSNIRLKFYILLIFFVPSVEFYIFYYQVNMNLILFFFSGVDKQCYSP